MKKDTTKEFGFREAFELHLEKRFLTSLYTNIEVNSEKVFDQFNVVI